MRPPSLLAPVLLVGYIGCAAGPSVSGDGSSDGSSTDDAVLDDGSPEVGEEGGEPLLFSGPLTYVAAEVLATDERLCDLDGDGVLDNAVADLGGTHSELLLAALNNILTAPEDGVVRWVFHFPLVDDLQGLHDSDAVLVFAQTRDGDEPPDPADDFDGDEEFLVSEQSIDACGEPLHVFPSTVVEDGAVRTTVPGLLGLDIGAGQVLLAAESSVVGSLDRGEGGGTFRACGILELSHLGLSVLPELGPGDLTLLEVLLSGGTAVGFPAVPGVTPDLDLDGDGLERFELDGSSHVVRCIDGDRSIIEGRDCWQDERMADGISMAMRFVTVGARLGGFVGGADRWDAGECPEPPEQSLWAPR